MFSLIYCKIHSLSTHILFGLPLDSYKTFQKTIVIVTPFLPLKGTNYALKLKISIAHDKKRIPFVKFTY